MYRPWLHRLAVLTAVATFILICMGGLVTSTNSGLAVPDWPTTFGYNMFLYPLSKTVSGFLFSIDPNLQADLNKGNLSIELRKGLEKNEISVSKNVIISTETQGSRWKLTDKANERTYTLIKSGERLDVYVHGVLYEHGHRLIGSIVGFLTIALMVFNLGERCAAMDEMARRNRPHCSHRSRSDGRAPCYEPQQSSRHHTRLFCPSLFWVDSKSCVVHFAQLVTNIGES